MHLITAAAL